MEREGVSLRKAEISDADRILEMQKTAFREIYEKYRDEETNPVCESLEKVRMRIIQEGRVYYLIEVGKKTVGAINIAATAGGMKKIAPIFLLPEFQGYGYAEETIRKLEEIYGSEHWELETILEEEKLCRFYEKLGYRKTSKITPVNDRMNLIEYRK